MKQRCEVCENFRPGVELDPAMHFVEWSFGSRIIGLCRAHARIAVNAGVTSFEGLRELYGRGRRSFVPRRNPAPPGVLGERRLSPGRRAEDAR
jgi:hypothetical protein